MARLRHPPGDPRVAEFIEALRHINNLADQAPGFLWRHLADGGHLTVTDDDPLTMLNLSVWSSYQPLHDFTYRGQHGHYLRRRHEWFEQVPPPTTVLWWIPVGTTPTPAQALARLAHLRRYGPTPQAFTVRIRFEPGGRPDRRRGPTTSFG